MEFSAASCRPQLRLLARIFHGVPFRPRPAQHPRLPTQDSSASPRAYFPPDFLRPFANHAYRCSLSPFPRTIYQMIRNYTFRKITIRDIAPKIVIHFGCTNYTKFAFHLLLVKDSLVNTIIDFSLTTKFFNLISLSFSEIL